MPAFEHVSSSRNRASIQQHGLDWTRMGAATGIAGSHVPEVAGCFLCTESYMTEFIVGLNNTSGPVDVWRVDGVGDDELLWSSEGFPYIARRVPPAHVTLLRTEPYPPQRPD